MRAWARSGGASRARSGAGPGRSRPRSRGRTGSSASAPGWKPPTPRGGAFVSTARASRPAGSPTWRASSWLRRCRARRSCFLEGAVDRRRFLDRLVFAGDPGHAVQVAAYERALRERMRILAEPPADPAWLSALEARLAKAGAAIAIARAETLRALDRRDRSPSRSAGRFRQAELALSGAWEQRAAGSAAAAGGALAGRAGAGAGRRTRTRDAAAGRALSGPHRGDPGRHPRAERPPFAA